MQVVKLIITLLVIAYSGYLAYGSFKTHNYKDLVMAIVLIGLLTLTNFVAIVFVSGPSMQPNFQTGDCILVLRSSKVERFDIAVVNFQNRKLIKRVVGMPNESISLTDGKTFINGQSIEEPFKYHEGNSNITNLKVGSDQIFVIGDNRLNSKDSRYFGPVPTTEIYGKMIYRFKILSKIPFLAKIIHAITG